MVSGPDYTRLASENNASDGFDDSVRRVYRLSLADLERPDRTKRAINPDTSEIVAEGLTQRELDAFLKAVDRGERSLLVVEDDSNANAPPGAHPRPDSAPERSELERDLRAGQAPFGSTTVATPGHRTHESRPWAAIFTSTATARRGAGWNPLTSSSQRTSS